MLSISRAVVLIIAAASIGLGVGIAPAAASTLSPGLVGVPVFGVLPVGVATPTLQGVAPCGLATGPHGVGATAGTTNQVCTGAGPTFIGPSLGQISSVNGPTIGAGVVIGTQVTSGGGVVAG